MRIGIMGALPEEVAAVAEAVERPVRVRRGERTYTSGSRAGHEVVCVHARIGKVAAAVATTELISSFKAELVLFTGLAGALHPELHPGDLVIGEGFYQHDLDASPLFPPLEIPLTGRSRLEASPWVVEALAEAAERAGSEDRRVMRGDIVSGDRFIACGRARERLLDLVPSALCVEMEGAAVAQVCVEFGVPFGVVRVISDRADGAAADGFTESLAADTAAVSSGVISRALARFSQGRPGLQPR